MAGYWPDMISGRGRVLSTSGPTRKEGGGWGGGECIAAGRVRLLTPCVRKLSKADGACIRRWRTIVKFTSIAVVELLSRSSR